MSLVVVNYNLLDYILHNRSHEIVVVGVEHSDVDNFVAVVEVVDLPVHTVNEIVVHNLHKFDFVVPVLQGEVEKIP